MGKKKNAQLKQNKASATTSSPDNKKKQPLSVPKEKISMSLLPIPVKTVEILPVEDFKTPKRNFKKMLKNSALVLSGIIVLGGIFVMLGVYSNDRVYPRVFVGPVAVGYKSSVEAKQTIENAINSYLKKPIAFSYGVRETMLTPEELGAVLNVSHTLNNLPVIHFNGLNLGALATSLKDDQKIYLQFNVDNEKIAGMLEKKLDLDALKPQNAHFTSNKDKSLEIVAEKEGRVIDRTKLFNALSESFQNLSSEPIHINLINEKPQIFAEDLLQKKNEFLASIRQPITLTYEGLKWKLNLQDHIDALVFETESALKLTSFETSMPVVLAEATISPSKEFNIADSFHMVISRDKIEDYLQKEITSKINKQTSKVKIFKDAQGKITIEGKGQNGLAVQEGKLIASLNLAIRNKLNTVEIPVQEEKAPVDIAPDLQDLGIKEMISTGHTSFIGSHTGRVKNIKVGIDKYNGLLVKPGETFSFNDILGPVDAAHGFVPEKVIKQDKAIDEYGGGLCQVSSTVYRAALLGGLKIAERAPHSWLVPYYGQVLGPGLDATIYPGVRDFKFVNDTPGNILMQAYTEGEHAYFKFYGTSDGRTAELDGPYGKGLSYKWYRTVVDKDGEVQKETITSNYKPQPVATPTPVVAKPTLNFAEDPLVPPLGQPVPINS